MGGEWCETCRYWREHAGRTEIGDCRKGLPIIRFEDDTDGHVLRYGFWPVTLGEDWCGEYRPRAERGVA